MVMNHGILLLQKIHQWVNQGDVEALKSLIQEFGYDQKNEDIKVVYRWVANSTNSIMWLDQEEYNPRRRFESWSKNAASISGEDFKKGELIYCLRYKPYKDEVVLDFEKLEQYGNFMFATEQEVIIEYETMPIQVEIIKQVTYR